MEYLEVMELIKVVEQVEFVEFIVFIMEFMELLVIVDIIEVVSNLGEGIDIPQQALNDVRVFRLRGIRFQLLSIHPYSTNRDHHHLFFQF